ncbi:O-antigen ligase family protein [Emticicia fontis]
MEGNTFYSTNRNIIKNIWLIPIVLMTIACGWLIAKKGIAIGVIFIVLPFIIGFVTLVFLKPRVGIYTYIVYVFVMPTIGKHIPGLQVGLGTDGILLLTLFAILFFRSDKFKFRYVNNDLFWTAVVWFVITILQLGNPERPSVLGWVYEMRSATLYWILTIPLSILLFYKKSDINTFFTIIIVLSFIGAVYGVKQMKMGPDAAENRWLEEGPKKTHILFGKLRVFSYYSDAAQFGASQAHIAIMCIILAVGPHSKKKKLTYLIAGLVIMYGMIISGTRGALFGLVGGGFMFLVLSKQVKILLLGAIVGGGALGVLKYTTIGNQNAEIRRLRTSLDPKDPSLQVRFINQQILANYIKNKPFGAGVGTMGTWGTTYNKNKYISTIPPDSLYVKIWGMYGIVGFLIWFGMMMYILGKSAGIIWKTRDPVLKNQLASLCSGVAGILLCSYGNEVLNAMPSEAVVYISLAFIWLSPRWDTPEPKVIEVKENEESVYS